MDTLASMRTFLSVVETGSFTRAAEQLSLSTAMATKHVNYLESRLGVRLLNRTTRRLNLTEAGRNYRERCAQILADVEEAEGLVGDLNGQPAGTLRVTATYEFGTFQIGPVAMAFAERHPRVSVDLLLTNQVLDFVRDSIDVSIRLSIAPDANVPARRLATSRVLLCAAPDYLARRGTPQTVDDLHTHNCLHFQWMGLDGQWPFETPEGQRLTKVHGNLASNGIEVLRKAAADGFGLTLLPSFVAIDDLRSGRLVALEQFKFADISIYAMYLNRRYLPAKVRTFIDFLAQSFGPNPYEDHWWPNPQQQSVA